MLVPERIRQAIPLPVVDNSLASNYDRCPTRALYENFLERAHPHVNFPADFGVALHRFYETLEFLYLDKQASNGGTPPDPETIDVKRATLEALKKYPENPPVGHPKEFLNHGRLLATCEEAYKNWVGEKRQGQIRVIKSEIPFNLPLPSGRIYYGRMDQLVEWRGDLWVRDFKHTTWLGETYEKRFDPNHQFTGYVWAAEINSGRPVKGVIVSFIYNTKNTGPEFKQHYSYRKKQDVKNWLIAIEKTYDDIELSLAQGRFPMRTVSCGHYGGCPWRKACMLADWESIELYLRAESIEHHWDPLQMEEIFA